MWSDAESRDCLINQIFHKSKKSIIALGRERCFTHRTPAAGSRNHCWCCSPSTPCPPPGSRPPDQSFSSNPFIATSKNIFGGTSQLPHLGSQSTLQTSVDQLDFAEKYLISQAWLYLYNFGKAVFNAQLCRELFLVHNCVESCQSLRVAIIRSRCMG